MGPPGEETDLTTANKESLAERSEPRRYKSSENPTNIFSGYVTSYTDLSDVKSDHQSLRPPVLGVLPLVSNLMMIKL